MNPLRLLIVILVVLGFEGLAYSLYYLSKTNFVVAPPILLPATIEKGINSSSALDVSPKRLEDDVNEESPKRLEEDNVNERTLNVSPKRLEDVNESSLSSKCNVNGSLPMEGPGGHKVLQKVKHGLEASRKVLADMKSDGKRAPRILCMVYSYNARHDDYLRSVVQTWGRQCDGFFAASDVNATNLGAITLPMQGEEEYSNIWQKVRSMFKYAAENYRG
jgi:hypothetical protein